MNFCAKSAEMQEFSAFNKCFHKTEFMDKSYKFAPV